MMYGYHFHLHHHHHCYSPFFTTTPHYRHHHSLHQVPEDSAEAKAFAKVSAKALKRHKFSEKKRLLEDANKTQDEIEASLREADAK
jgi:hypothetical protein